MDQIFNNIIQDLKKDDVVRRLCAKNGFDVEWLDYVPIMFDDLPVSAKTDHGVIIINKKLLDMEDPYFEIMHYIVHEFVHYLDQCFGTKGTKSSNDGNYLDNIYEQKAFQYQVKFLADNKSEEEAENYVDDLITHHNISNEDKDDKKDLLMSKI